MLVQPFASSCVVYRLPLKILLVGFVEDESFLDLHSRVMSIFSNQNPFLSFEETRDENSDWHKEGYFKRHSSASILARKTLADQFTTCISSQMYQAIDKKKW